jgi:hypothetical protein
MPTSVVQSRHATWPGSPDSASEQVAAAGRVTVSGQLTLIAAGGMPQPLPPKHSGLQISPGIVQVPGVPAQWPEPSHTSPVVQE